jgi:hypothetical protein
VRKELNGWAAICLDGMGTWKDVMSLDLSFGIKGAFHFVVSMLSGKSIKEGNIASDKETKSKLCLLTLAAASCL